MNKYLIAAASVALALGTVGCTHQRSPRVSPSLATGLAVDRTEKMEAIADDLRSRGYSEDRAKQIAAKQVPLIETTYSESITSILAGAAERKKFREDLTRAARQK